MIRLGFGAVFLALLGGCATPAFDPDQIALASKKAQQAADLMFQRLSGELASAMANGGPAAAILICKDRAPAIAAEISSMSGVDIERTAMRIRNPANAPDAWERTTMESFVARRKAGEAWTEMSATRVEEGDLRWMRPIPLGAMCASCHGEPAMISPDTRRALLAFYPSDQAVGFGTGELRGAFTARAPLGSQ